MKSKRYINIWKAQKMDSEKFCRILEDYYRGVLSPILVIIDKPIDIRVKLL